jgi:hypothetical protein
MLLPLLPPSQERGLKLLTPCLLHSITPVQEVSVWFPVVGCVGFARRNIFASKRNKAKPDPFRMHFARSREKKIFLFASNFSLPTKAKLKQRFFALFRFEAKRNKRFFASFHLTRYRLETQKDDLKIVLRFFTDCPGISLFSLGSFRFFFVLSTLQM